MSFTGHGCKFWDIASGNDLHGGRSSAKFPVAIAEEASRAILVQDLSQTAHPCDLCSVSGTVRSSSSRFSTRVS